MIHVLYKAVKKTILKVGACIGLKRYSRFRYILDDNITVGRFTKIDSQSKVGDFTYIGKNCDITKAIIGRYCSIANNVSIGPGEHDINRISTSSLLYKDGFDDLTHENCIIEDDVWIGVDSIIRRGVTVGTGSVVAANSFVNKDIPPFAVVGGNPARIIRYRLRDSASRDLVIKSKWWELPPEDARKVVLIMEEKDEKS